MSKSAKEMANKKFEGRWAIRVFLYSLRDNPYPRKHPKHAEWHNEFYYECRRIGRGYK